MPFFDPYPLASPSARPSVPFPLNLLPTRYHSHPIVTKLSPHLALRAYTWQAPQRPPQPRHGVMVGRRSFDAQMIPERNRLEREYELRRLRDRLGAANAERGLYRDPPSYDTFYVDPVYPVVSTPHLRRRARSLPTGYYPSLGGRVATTGYYADGTLSSNMQSLAPRFARTEYVKAGLPGYTPPPSPLAEPYRWSDPGYYGYEPPSGRDDDVYTSPRHPYTSRYHEPHPANRPWASTYDPYYQPTTSYDPYSRPGRRRRRSSLPNYYEVSPNDSISQRQGSVPSPIVDGPFDSRREGYVAGLYDESPRSFETSFYGPGGNGGAGRRWY